MNVIYLSDRNSHLTVPAKSHMTATNNDEKKQVEKLANSPQIWVKDFRNNCRFHINRTHTYVYKHDCMRVGPYFMMYDT